MARLLNVACQWTALAVLLCFSYFEGSANAFSTTIGPHRALKILPGSPSHPSPSLVPRSTTVTSFQTRRSKLPGSSSSRSTTRLYWSPLDEQSPSDNVGKMLMLIGTVVEITRAIIMGATGSATEMLHELASQVSTVDIMFVWTPIFIAINYSWDKLSNPPEDYRSDMEPYARGEYNPDQAQDYYQKHPILVLQRFCQVLKISNQFIAAMLVDKYVTGNQVQNRPQRAQELLELMTQLGPTAIKVGQALSVRPDLIPQEFSDALATLQDQVPPFDSAKAKEILQGELGMEKFGHLKGLDDKAGPVASASIGQVYKVTLAGNKVVAVKVQRPNVLAEIALDLYLVRKLAPWYMKLTNSGSDLKALANEWGRGFIAELDYRKEAANTVQFNREMAKRNMNAVCAPNVVQEYSTERILVTDWVDGTRIDHSEESDIPRLCSVALNAYLVMLLELSSLHCDPHPGNLLRTKDGKLCILDFGMTLEIDPNLQYSLLEYVAHLTADDYNQLPEDLTKLGFLKEDKLDFARRSGVLEPLKYFLKQVGQGGGAQRFRDRIMSEYREKYPGMSDEELRVAMRSEMEQHIQVVADRESVTTGITMEVEELQRQNRDAFQIPEWFLYTSRAFLTLEGVSLQADPSYSLIKSCFPYVAKRLVGDDDPRAVQALRNMIYGRGDSIDPKRVSDLVDGFSSYTTTTKTINQQGKAVVEEGLLLSESDGTQRVSGTQHVKGSKEKLEEAQAAITLAKDSADILLAPKGNFVQSMMVEEGVLAASARFKDDLRKSVVEGPERLRNQLPFGVGKVLPPLPFETRIRNQLEPFIKKTSRENNAQALAEKMMQLLPRPRSGSSSSDEENNDRQVVIAMLREMEPEQAALLLKELRENVPKYAPLVRQLGGKFASTLLRTASSNIETTLHELEQAGQKTDNMLRVTAKGLSSAAKRGSSVFGGGGENNKKDRFRHPPPGDSDLMPQARIVPMSDFGNSTVF